jgi:hypothetical protein
MALLRAATFDRSRSGTALCLLATPVGIRLRIFPVLSAAVHRVFHLHPARAILAQRMGTEMGILAWRATRF